MNIIDPIDQDHAQQILELDGEVKFQHGHIHNMEKYLGSLRNKILDQHGENQNMREYLIRTEQNYANALKAKEYENERLNGRIIHLEEMLKHHQNQNKVLKEQFKDDFDPDKIRELERMLALKDNEIGELQRQLKNLQDKVDCMINEALNNQKKHLSFEKDWRAMPFVLENDVLKKTNEDLRKEQKNLNNKINELQSKQRDLEGQLEAANSRIKKFELLEKLRGPDEETKKKTQPLYLKVQEEKNLLENVLGLIHYIRESINDLIFEVFVRSANQAHTQKQHSTVLFIINTKEIKDRHIRALIILLFTHRKMKQLIKMYYPNYGKVGLLSDTAQNHRDHANDWIEGSIEHVIQKYKEEKNHPERDYLELFRFLAIRYRIKYPQNGVPISQDLDLRVRLENKICSILLRVFVDKDE